MMKRRSRAIAVVLVLTALVGIALAADPHDFCDCISGGCYATPKTVGDAQSGLNHIDGYNYLFDTAQEYADGEVTLAEGELSTLTMTGATFFLTQEDWEDFDGYVDEAEGYLSEDTTNMTQLASAISYIEAEGDQIDDSAAYDMGESSYCNVYNHAYDRLYFVRTGTVGMTVAELWSGCYSGYPPTWWDGADGLSDQIADLVEDFYSATDAGWGILNNYCEACGYPLENCQCP